MGITVKPSGKDKSLYAKRGLLPATKKRKVAVAPPPTPVKKKK